MSIKAITLDLDDTLWPIWPTIRHAEEALLFWMQENTPVAAQSTSTEHIRQIRNQLGEQYPEWQHDLSLYRLEAIRQILTQSGEDEQLAHTALDVYLAARQQVTLYDDALPALKRLSCKFPIIAITNGNADLKQIGIDQYFQDIVTAKQMGVSKPDKKLFHQAQMLLNCDATQILHVGDDLNADVIGALKVGMQAAWIQRAAEQIKPPCLAYTPQYIAQNLLELCEELGI